MGLVAGGCIDMGLVVPADPKGLKPGCLGVVDWVMRLMGLRPAVGVVGAMAQGLSVSPLRMAEGSIMPACAWAVAGSMRRAEEREARLLSFCSTRVSSVFFSLMTTVDC